MSKRKLTKKKQKSKKRTKIEIPDNIPLSSENSRESESNSKMELMQNSSSPTKKRRYLVSKHKRRGMSNHSIGTNMISKDAWRQDQIERPQAKDAWRSDQIERPQAKDAWRPDQIFQSSKHNTEGYAFAPAYTSDNSVLLKHACDYIREKMKNVDGSFMEGIYQVIFTRNNRAENIMIINYFDTQKVASDCGHDFNGERGSDSEIARQIKEETLKFLNLPESINDNAKVSAIVKQYIDNRSDIMKFTGPKDKLRNDLLPLISQLTNLPVNTDAEHFTIEKNPELEENSLSSVTPDSQEISYSEDMDNSEKSTYTKKELEKKEVKSNQRESNLENISPETAKKNLQNAAENNEEKIISGALNVLLDQGVSCEYNFKKYTKLTSSEIQQIYDQDKKNVPLKSNNNLNFTHFTDFKLAGIAMTRNEHREKDVSLFIEHAIDDNVLNLKKEFVSVAGGRKSFVTPPEVSNLISQVSDSNITGIEAELAKFLGDHILTTSYLLKKAECLPQDEDVSMYGITHDLRSFRDNACVELVMADGIHFLKTPMIYSSPDKDKRKYLYFKGQKTIDVTDELNDRFNKMFGTKNLSDEKKKKEKENLLRIITKEENVTSWQKIEPSKEITAQIVKGVQMTETELAKQAIENKKFDELRKKEKIDRDNQLKKLRENAEKKKIEKLNNDLKLLIGKARGGFDTRRFNIKEILNGLKKLETEAHELDFECRKNLTRRILNVKYHLLDEISHEIEKSSETLTKTTSTESIIHEINRLETVKNVLSDKSLWKLNDIQQSELISYNKMLNRRIPEESNKIETEITRLNQFRT